MRITNNTTKTKINHIMLQLDITDKSSYPSPNDVSKNQKARVCSNNSYDTQNDTWNIKQKSYGPLLQFILFDFPEFPLLCSAEANQAIRVRQQKYNFGVSCPFKEIVHPTTKKGHPRCRWVFSSSEQIWINSELHHLLTNGSSVNGWVPSEWKTKQLIKASQ